MPRYHFPFLLAVLLFCDLGCLTTGGFLPDLTGSSTDCPMTKVPLSPGSALSNSGVRVIHDRTEWDAYYKDLPGTDPTPILPPIDFTSQMLVIAAVPAPCNNTTLTITKVCEDSDLVTVYVTSTSCPNCANCMIMPNSADITSEVAVPLSKLPVSIVTKERTRRDQE